MSLKANYSIECRRCWKSKEVLGIYVCGKDRNEGCPANERLKLEIEGGRIDVKDRVKQAKT